MIRTVSLAILLLPIGLLTVLVAIDESKPDRVTQRADSPSLIPLDRVPVPPVYQVVRFMDLEWAAVAGESPAGRGTEIRCEVSPSPGGRCASITYILSDLSHVKKGDRLLEFDRSPYIEQLRSAQLALAAAEAELVQLRTCHDAIVREKEKEKVLRERTRSWREMDLICFNEDLPKKRKRLQEQIEACTKEVSVREAAQPHAAKYSELTEARDRLADAEAELSLITTRAPTEKLRLELAVEKAKREVRWALSLNDAKYQENNNRLGAAITIRDLWSAEVARISRQLEGCIISAPHAGLLLYNGSPHVGEEIRNGEHVLTVIAGGSSEATKTEQVLVIPATAVQQDDAGSWCFELTNQGVQSARIVTGRRNQHFVEVRQGLSEGDQVVVDLTAFPFQITYPRSLSGVAEDEGHATIIRCEVARPDNRVRFVVDKAVVKGGDLLVEIDSGPLDGAIQSSIQQHTKALSDASIAGVVEWRSRLRNQCDIAEAEEQVRLANAELAQWGNHDDPRGSMQIESQHYVAHLANAQQEIGQFRSEVREAKEQYAKAETDFKLGTGDESTLKAKRQLLAEAETRLASAADRLAQLGADRNRYEQWEGAMKRAKAKQKSQDAATHLDVTKKAGEDEIAVAVAAKKAAESRQVEARDALEQLESQKQNCKVYAPHDGWLLVEDAVRTEARVVVGQELAKIVPKTPTLVTNAVVIPRSALSQVGNQSYCLVRTECGLERRAIKLGVRNGSECQVIAGLGFGELVVRDPAMFLSPSATTVRPTTDDLRSDR